jgi:hypothetical protein
VTGDYYVFNKLAKGLISTNNIDNSRCYEQRGVQTNAGGRPPLIRRCEITPTFIFIDEANPALPPFCFIR